MSLGSNVLAEDEDQKRAEHVAASSPFRWVAECVVRESARFASRTWVRVCVGVFVRARARVRERECVSV